jgi:hypothetical protein
LSSKNQRHTTALLKKIRIENKVFGKILFKKITVKVGHARVSRSKFESVTSTRLPSIKLESYM